MTFTSHTQYFFTRGAVAGLALLTAAGLAACGSDDKGGDSASDFDPDKYFSVEGALAEFRPKVEALGYTCNPLPDAKFDNAVSLSCLPDDVSARPILTLFNQEDVATGAEIAEAKLDEMLEASKKANQDPALSEYNTREVMGMGYLALDGGGITGHCNDIGGDCEQTANALGLKVSLLDGVLTKEERDAQVLEQSEKALEEYEAKQEAERKAEEEREKAEAEKRRQELQTYRGWSNLEQAMEQLEAWDIACREDSASGGKIAWCERSIMNGSSLIAVDYSVDKLEKNGVFKNIDRKDMYKVSDGKWVFICSEGQLNQCNLIAQKTGKKVVKGA